MSGRVVRAACTAALATATVLAGVPFASGAVAEPGDETASGTSASASPSPSRDKDKGRDRDSGRTGTDGPDPEKPGPGNRTDGTSAFGDDPLDAEGGAFGAGAPAGTAALDAGLDASTPRTVSGMLSRLQLLYRQAEQATEAFNATEAELTRQRAETKRLTAALARSRTALSLSRGDAGRLARRQYQGQSELSGYLRLLLARDPQQALEESYLVRRTARDRAHTLARLAGTEKRAAALATASREALGRQQTLATKQRKQRDMVKSRLLDVEKLLASLSRRQIAAVAALEKAGTDEAQRELLASGALGDAFGEGAATQAGAPGAPGGEAGRAPSAEGGDAVRYAVEQIGKPYEWGAEGPDTFDCSGLTQQAWARAGVSIPRTSQEQWDQLPRISLRELRPGDLVIYFPEATHVAIYLGGGMVIQAPRPGASVKVSPIAANPLLGAVRPDPEARSLNPGAYVPPELPEGAMDGADTGYNQA
ncbi:C40 family peptidase [Streptomyces lushanensis]|uniref:C40 family peptidase n=1 Tax=Streptomyces lushanensis TaxID=1434255 RepID=UPI00082BEC54|nr:C40 family peptidase [Streptomyces lushanensis]